MTTIAVRHNVEMAHRLSMTPGKCENIHGHSWWVTLLISGEIDLSGKVREFGEVKRAFRSYLDSEFDHRLLLWEDDPIIPYDISLPGLTTFETDPTTENLAVHLRDWAVKEFGTTDVEVEVWETSVNMARTG